MKKKILSIAVMALTIATLLAVSVFADETIKLYYDGTKQHTHEIEASGTNSTWSSENTSVATVDGNGLVTAVGVGQTKIREFDENGNDQRSYYNIEVVARTLNGFEFKTYPTKNTYTSGETFDPTGLSIILTYDNEDEVEVAYSSASGITCSPSVLHVGDTVTVSYGGKTKSLTGENAIQIEEHKPTSIKIVSPYANKEYKEGDCINDVKVEITYNNDNKDTMTIVDRFTQTPSATTKLTKDVKELKVEYNGLTDKIAIIVKEKKPEETKRITNLTDGYVTIIDTRSNTYIKGDSYNPNGLNVPLYYSDGSSKTITLANISSIKLDTVGNNCTVTVANVSDGGTLKFNLKITGIKVEDAIDIVGLDNDKDEYELNDKYKLEIGDKLDWEDFFKEVRIAYKEGSKTKYKTIEDEDDLERYFPGAKLHLEVYKNRGKKDADVVEETTANGEVELILYIEYAGKNLYSSSSQYIRFTAKVKEAGVGVRIYSSSTSTSSTYLEATKYFDDLKDALDALEEYEKGDEDDFEDIFGTDLGSKYVIYITINEDQKLGKNYSFKPEFENRIAIDLKGNKLSLPSEWIEYDKYNDDISIVVASSNTKNDGKLEYIDKDITIPVSTSDKLEFAKDKIPGFFKFKVDALTNGTASVKVDDKKLSKLPQASALEVVKGSKLSITVTPDKGYKINTVKNGTTSLSSKEIVDETAKSALYEITVKDDVDLKITFVKDTSASSTTSTTTKPAGPTVDEVINGWTNKFTDISSSDSYYKDVAYACASGYFNGTDSTKFSPKGEMTRAMFVTALGRLYEKSNNVNIKTNPKYANSTFSDVSASDASISYAIPYIQWAVEQSITNGVGNNKFDPKAPITHAQMYTFMYRYAQSQMVNLKYSGTEITVVDKNDIPTWSGAENAVRFATFTQTLIKDSSGRITPNSNAYRWELATIISKYAQNIKSWQAAN